MVRLPFSLLKKSRGRTRHQLLVALQHFGGRSRPREGMGDLSSGNLNELAGFWCTRNAIKNGRIGGRDWRVRTRRWRLPLRHLLQSAISGLLAHPYLVQLTRSCLSISRRASFQSRPINRQSVDKARKSACSPVSDLLYSLRMSPKSRRRDAPSTNDGLAHRKRLSAEPMLDFLFPVRGRFILTAGHGSVKLFFAPLSIVF